jgi:DtxR family Mn-dependent transcriptional regulator
MNKLTPSKQDYLETILALMKNNPTVRSIDVASALGFSRASVSRAISLLKADGFLTQERYGTISLTELGLKEAKAVRERHNLLKYYFIHILEVDELTAEADACKIEHIVSEKTLNQIEKYAAQHMAEHHQGSTRTSD